MAKKRIKGLTGKTSARVIATSVTAGVIALSIGGYSLFSVLSNRDQHISNPYGDDLSNIQNVETEPNVNVDPDFEYNPADPQVPGLNPDITNPGDEFEDMGVEFTEILSLLTTKSKDYIHSVTGSTPNNLIVTGFTAMNVDMYAGQVSLLGQVSIGDKFNNFVATIGNNDTSLDIYNLPADISNTEFIDAMHELLTNKDTTFKTQIKQYFKLSNESEIINDMLNARLDELKSLNSTEANVIAEISYINSLINNRVNLSLSVLLDSRTSGDNGYTYSFGLAIHTGKYMYTSSHSFNSTRPLATSALKHQIEEFLNNTNDYNATPSSAVNQALYINNQNLTAQDTTELSK